jgi:anti-sigma factor RsiW
VIDLVGGCRKHRAALIDFVDRRELGASAEAALAHLERCSRCVSELEATALTIMALRRLGEALAREEPRPDAWPRLRLRIERSRRRSFQWSLGTASPLLSMAMILVLAVPALLDGDIVVRGQGDGESTVARPVSRTYDPPAAALTAELVVTLARNDRLARPTRTQLFVIGPAARDRLEPGRRPVLDAPAGLTHLDEPWL